MTTQMIMYIIGALIVGVASALTGVKIHMSKKGTPAPVQNILNTVEGLGRDIGNEAKIIFTNGHEAIVAHGYKAAAVASDAARVATEVDKLILQYAGAAGKSVAALTVPDMQNVIAYVLHSLSPVDAHKVTPATVADAHAALVVAHNTLAADATFQAGQTAASYQASVPASVVH